MSFNLRTFVKNRTVEAIELCRKHDLLSIAAHFGIVVIWITLKLIKDKVLEGLADLKLLSSSISPAQPLGAKAMVEPCASGSEDEKEQATPLPNVWDGGRAPATLVMVAHCQKPSQVTSSC